MPPSLSIPTNPPPLSSSSGAQRKAASLPRFSACCRPLLGCRSERKGRAELRTVCPPSCAQKRGKKQARISQSPRSTVFKTPKRERNWVNVVWRRNAAVLQEACARRVSTDRTSVQRVRRFTPADRRCASHPTQPPPPSHPPSTSLSGGWWWWRRCFGGRVGGGGTHPVPSRAEK